MTANDHFIIVSVHSHILKETTIASREWECFVKDAQGNWKSNIHGNFANIAALTNTTSGAIRCR